MVGVCPPPPDEFYDRGLRFGPHNLHENRPGTYRSATWCSAPTSTPGCACTTCSDAEHPVEIAHWLPDTPEGQAAAQINDVFVGADLDIWVTDRVNGGVYRLRGRRRAAGDDARARAVSAAARSIDVHAHCVPVGVLETLVAEGGRYGIELAEQDGRYAALIGGRVQTRDILPSLSDLPRRLAAMDAAGVDVQLLASWIDLTAYSLDAATGVRYSRMFNEGLAATAAEAPDRFRALATVPLQAPKEAAEELRHAITVLGHVGVEIATTVDGRELDDPDLDPFWAAAEELRAVIVVHPYASLKGRGPQAVRAGQPDRQPGRDHAGARPPDLRRRLRAAPRPAHGAGARRRLRAVPDRPLGPRVHHRRPRRDRAPHAGARRVATAAVLRHRPALGAVAAAPRRRRRRRTTSCSGSDYPFVMGEPEPVRSLDAVPGLGDGEREQILAGNLATLLDDVGRLRPRVDLTVNGTSRQVDADPDTPLLDVLRGDLGLRGRAVRLRAGPVRGVLRAGRRAPRAGVRHPALGGRGPDGHHGRGAGRRTAGCTRSSRRCSTSRPASAASASRAWW